MEQSFFFSGEASVYMASCSKVRTRTKRRSLEEKKNYWPSQEEGSYNNVSMWFSELLPQELAEPDPGIYKDLLPTYIYIHTGSRSSPPRLQKRSISSCVHWFTPSSSTPPMKRKMCDCLQCDVM